MNIVINWSRLYDIEGPMLIYSILDDFSNIEDCWGPFVPPTKIDKECMNHELAAT